MATADELLIRDAHECRGELVARARGELGPWRDVAEDMVQEAYLQLLGRIEAGEAPRSPRAWLHAVVRSRCADERRRRARETTGDPDGEPSPAPGPEERAVTAAEAIWCLAQVATLPPNERDAVLGHVAGRSASQTAAGRRTANAVHQALHRGRARLRQAHRAAWSALFPLPLRHWVSRTTPALPVSPHGGLGGLGGLGGAVAVAGISVLGLAGGVQLSGVHPRPDAPGAAVRAVTGAGGGASGDATRPVHRSAERVPRTPPHAAARVRAVGGDAHPPDRAPAPAASSAAPARDDVAPTNGAQPVAPAPAPAAAQAPSPAPARDEGTGDSAAPDDGLAPASGVPSQDAEEPSTAAEPDQAETDLPGTDATPAEP